MEYTQGESQQVTGESTQVSNSESISAIQLEIKKAEKALKQQERTLKNLISQNAAQAVIDAQEKAIEDAKQALETVKQKRDDIENTLPERAKKAEASKGFISFEVVNDDDWSRETVQKKISFVKHNRTIDSKRVALFIHLIASEKYDKANPIMVADATFLIEKDYIVIDMDGNKIDPDDAEDYYTIIDGQHRGMAFAKLIAIEYDTSIPNVHIRNKDNIGEYLVDINEACKSWDNKDRFAVAGVTRKDDEIYTTISARICEGYNPTTASKIYIGKRITASILNKALKGESPKLPKGAEFNKKRGDKFITLCQAVGMPVSLITRRYFIEGFNSHATSVGEEQAFASLKALSGIGGVIDSLKRVRDSNDFITILKEGKLVA